MTEHETNIEESREKFPAERLGGTLLKQFCKGKKSFLEYFDSVEQRFRERGPRFDEEMIDRICSGKRPIEE